MQFYCYFLEFSYPISKPMSEVIKQEGSVAYKVADAVATITFFHPKSNSMPGALLRQLAETIAEVGQKQDVRVIVLQSEGEKAFCSGASFDELVSIDNFEQGKKFFMGFASVINAARKCPKFIIGRVQGKAVGGGVGMASAVDYCMATSEASIKLSELAVGIGPFVVGPAVARKVGQSAFQALSIDTEWRSAEWAREKGLYTDVFANVADMDAAIAKLASKLAKSSPEAMAQIKQICWEDCIHWDTLLESRAEMSGRLVLSDFTKNFIRSFKNS